MYDYLRDELPQLINNQFQVADRCAISGHSMGGHGALIMALKTRALYQRLGLRADRQPMQSSVGTKAFSAYLGDDEATGRSGTAAHSCRQARPGMPFPH